MYNPNNQYRCPIIRGKSQSDIDNLLPAYAQIIDEICPCSKGNFEIQFNAKLETYLPGHPEAKTLNNHRTEIAGKLFGMYYIETSEYDGKQYVYAGERTLKFLHDQDQPAFFKDVCFKMQFPNGMAKPNTITEQLNKKISIRPCCYIVKVLLEAERRKMMLTKNDIGYYVLNSLDALKRIALPKEVVDAIENDRKKGVRNHDIGDATKEYSYNVQHINEQINYMELANLIIVMADEKIRLNKKEQISLDVFSNYGDENPGFAISTSNLSTIEKRKNFQLNWDRYYASLSNEVDSFKTNVDSLIDDDDIFNFDKKIGDTTELGDEGERFVYEYEKNRVSEFNPRLVNKVLALGKTKGLGYDIQTIIAEPGEESEFVKYIEVKSTKRVTEPDIEDSLWTDTINVTRNEWTAARQHGRFYSIYRVYFVRGNVIMYLIENPFKLFEEKTIEVVPTMYRIDFGKKAVTQVITN